MDSSSGSEFEALAQVAALRFGRQVARKDEPGRRVERVHVVVVVVAVVVVQVVVEVVVVVVVVVVVQVVVQAGVVVGVPRLQHRRGIAPCVS